MIDYRLVTTGGGSFQRYAASLSLSPLRSLNARKRPKDKPPSTVKEPPVGTCTRVRDEEACACGLRPKGNYIEKENCLRGPVPFWPWEKRHEVHARPTGTRTTVYP